ncbi:MAG: tetratricopeptide repeat protein, partial [Nitrospinaceae bacterium]
MALVYSGCASDGSEPAEQQIAALQTISSEPDKKLFSQALIAQNKGQTESAIKLWKSYLAQHPESYEAHNNLGSFYYNQDMLTQALKQFETAYRLQPGDEKIRKNLVRALRFKASMLHESREYFKTLEVLARLENIVEPEEKQAILFKQEQVEDQIFLQVIKANNSAAYQDFINRFPDGFNAVRAHEYLEKHPKRVSKASSHNKSWISSGKAVANPSGDSGNTKSWVSSKQPPDYSTSSPTAIYTPPPAGTKKRKGGDFFGVDAGAVEGITDDNVTTSQEIDRAKAIPFEDFEKPERASGEQAPVKERAEGSDIRRAGAESDPIRGEPDT